VASSIDTLFTEFRKFFEPLRLALVSPDELAAFLRRFGFEFDGSQVSAAAGQLAPMAASIEELSETTSAALADGIDAADLVTIADAAQPLFEGIANFSESISNIAPGGALSPQDYASALEAMPEELFDVLLTEYLSLNAPIVLHSLAFLDVVRNEKIPAQGHARSRGIAYAMPSYQWDRIGLLFDDPSAWAEQSYGWGVDFQSDKFIRRLARIFEYLGGYAEIREMSPAQTAVFMPHLAASPVPPTFALAPVVKSLATRTSEEAGAYEGINELGLAFFPVAGKTDPASNADNGIGVAPYTEGTIAESIDLSANKQLKLTGNIGAVGGIVFSYRPSGASVDLGVDEVAFSGSFTVELVVNPSDGQATIIFIGEPGSTRIEASSIVASVGGSASNAGGDFFAAFAVKTLHVVIDASGDGLLGSILSGPVDVQAGDIVLGWRSGRGLYFEGGTSIAVKIPVDKQLGPFHLYDIGVALDWKDAVSATGTVTADARIGPLYAFVEGLGLTTRLVPSDHGTLGRYDIEFGLKFPTGYAVALEAAPIEGGGYLSVRDNEYRGALALKFETFGFSAFAILNTRLPGGARGFSFVASIFGDFVIPLGYGFFLTGLGGLIGINRTVNTEGLRQVLYGGELDSILFPDDPITNAATILDNTALIFPPREDQYVFGPMARIAFNQPALIEGKLGVVLEIGKNTRILILGALGTHLPSRDTPLVSLEVSFFGEIDFGAGTVSFDATLQNSYVLAWGVSGDMAVRTGWAQRINHVVSFGGLHPRFPRPANLPDLRRMSINFGSNNPRVTMWCYQAVTLNSLQFGAGADLYAKGPKIRFVGRLAAEGHVSFDALIYFNPFAFDAELSGSLSLLVDGDVIMGLGFDLRLTGPNNYVIDGRVWATVFGIDVGFGVRHEWGDRRDLPDAIADPIGILRDAIAAAPILESVRAKTLSDGVRFVQPPPGEESLKASSPVGALRFTQRALPLGVAIEKIGEASIVGGASTFDLAAFVGNDPVALNPADLEFVRGHFWKMSEADRLRTPAFERHKSGFLIASDALRADMARSIDVEYGYEFIHIGDDAVADASPLFPFATASNAPVTRWMEAHHRANSSPLDPVAVVSQPPDAPVVKEAGFAMVDTPDIVARPFSVADRSRLEGVAMKRNTVVAGWVIAGRVPQ
jgi:hypothetical protein